MALANAAMRRVPAAAALMRRWASSEAPTLVSRNKCFGGETVRYRHVSESTQTEMAFAVHVPDIERLKPAPVRTLDECRDADLLPCVPCVALRST